MSFMQRDGSLSRWAITTAHPERLRTKVNVHEGVIESPWEEIRMEKRLYLLLIEQELEPVIGAFCEVFGLENRGGGNTIRAGNGKLNVSVTVTTKEMAEAQDFFQQQLQAVWEHFYGVQTDLTDHKLNVLYQIHASGALVIVDYVYADDDVTQEKVMLNRMADILRRLDGLLLTGDGTHLLDKDLRLVLSDKGDSEVERFFPVERKLPQDFFEGAPLERVERRNCSVSFLRQQGIYVTGWLPLIEGEAEANFRSVEEVALRAAALLAVSLHAEVLMTQNMDVLEARSYSDSVIETYGCGEAFSPQEKAFLENNAPEQKEGIHFSWQYECLYVMLWALGHIDKLSFPDQICDVGAAVRIIRQYDSMDKLVGASILRTHEELLDEADLIYRMDWGCVDARSKGLPLPRNLEGGVVMERHKCLNWLIGSGNDDWDDVDVST